MYVDLTVPPIEKRHSEPFAANHLAVPQANQQNLPGCLSAPDLGSSPLQLFREFCSDTAPTPRSSPSKSGASSGSNSPKRSPPNAGPGAPQRRCSTAVVERRSSVACVNPAINCGSAVNRRRTDNLLDDWEEFHQKRAPPAPQNSFLSPNATGYRCRSFSITPKGSVLNLGEVVVADSSRRRSTGSCNDRSDIQLLTQRVRLVGAGGVGKSCLVEQFKDGFASNELGYLQIVTSPPSSAQCSLETQSTKILLDGEEFDIEFDELLSTDVNIDSVSRTDAFIVVYAVTDQSSFETAKDILKYLRRTSNYCRVGGGGKKRPQVSSGQPFQEVLSVPARPIVLAGNKSDLARKRIVSREEGRALAKRYECKFIETSACIGHNVDELLVETLKQIRLLKRRSSSLPGWSLSFPAKFVACSESSSDSQSLGAAASLPPLNPDGGVGPRCTQSSARSAGRSFCFKARNFLQRFWTRCDSGRTQPANDLDVL